MKILFISIFCLLVFISSYLFYKSHYSIHKSGDTQPFIISYPKDFTLTKKENDFLCNKEHYFAIQSSKKRISIVICGPNDNNVSVDTLLTMIDKKNVLSEDNDIKEGVKYKIITVNYPFSTGNLMHVTGYIIKNNYYWIVDGSINNQTTTIRSIDDESVVLTKTIIESFKLK
jgi:hypothetical protein